MVGRFYVTIAVLSVAMGVMMASSANEDVAVLADSVSLSDLLEVLRQERQAFLVEKREDMEERKAKKQTHFGNIARGYGYGAP